MPHNTHPSSKFICALLLRHSMDIGFCEIAPSNQAVFTNSLEGDLMMYTSSPTYNILMGNRPTQDQAASVKLTSTHLQASNIKLMINNATMSSTDDKLVIESATDVASNLNVRDKLYQNGIESKAWYVGTNNSVYVPLSVGINNNTPQHSLDVTGTINATTSYYENGIESRLFAAGTDTAQGADPMFTFRNVGFGTSNPSASYDATISTANISTQLYQKDIPSHAFFMANNGSLYYESNIGINNTDPQCSLDVNGTVNIDGQLYQKSNACHAMFHNTSTGAIYYTSNIGVRNANPQFGLDISATTNFASNVYVRGVQASLMQMGANNAPCSMSNLGVNTLAPQFNLDVQGTFNTLDMYQDGVQSTAFFNGPDGTIYYDCNVGVYTSTPSNALEVHGRIATSEDAYIPKIFVADGHTIEDSNNGAGLLLTTPRLIVQNNMGNATPVFQVSSRRIGVNTSSTPQATFHAYTSNNVPAAILCSTDTTPTVLQIATNNPATNLAISIDAAQAAITNKSTNPLHILNNNQKGITVQPNTGYIGINQKSPQAMLDVFNGNVRIQSSNQTVTQQFVYMAPITNTTSTLGIGMANEDADLTLDSKQGDAIIQSSTQILMQAGSTSQAALCISNTNSVGIMTTTPAAPFHVNTTSLFQNTQTLAQGASINLVNSTASINRSAADGAVSMCNNATISLNTTTGGVAINRATASYPLDVLASSIRITGQTDLDGYCIYTNQSGSSSSTWGAAGEAFGGGTHTSTPLVLQTSGLERLRVAPDGSIGIGTATPTSMLQFANSNLDKMLVFQDNNNNATEFYGVGCSNKKLKYTVEDSNSAHVFYSSSNELFNVSGNGSIGVNTRDIIPKGTMYMHALSACNSIVFEAGQAAFGSNNNGVSCINFNGYTSNDSPIVINSDYTRWRVKCDNTTSADSLTVDQYNGVENLEYLKMAESNIVMKYYVRILCPDDLAKITLSTSSSPVPISFANSNVMLSTWMLALAQDSAYKPGSPTWDTASDERIKQGICQANLDACYNTIKTLPLKEYHFMSDAPAKRKLGWIAQEVEPLLPHSVTRQNMYNYDDFRVLNADQIYANMYGAMQKMQQMIEALTARVAELEKRE